MAHCIGIHDHLVLARKPAWHGLGEVFDQAPGWEEGTHRLGWTVQVCPLVANYHDNEVEVPQAFAVIREDIGISLGVVGGRYVPIQNLEAFSLVKPLVDDGQCEIETCGSLHNGAKVFLLLKIKGEDLDIGMQKKDLLKSYLLVTSTHDGSSSLKVGFTCVRVVCQNTLTASLRGDGFTSIRHTASAEKAMALLQTTIDVGRRELASTAEIYKMMQEVQISRYRAIEIIAAYRDSKKTEKTEEISSAEQAIRDRMLEIFYKEGGSNGWNLYNAVNGYNVHEAGKSQETRVNKVWFGAGVAEDRTMLKFLCAEIGIAA
jgi:phage/plasmid-like protein (TIGR03299 family)